MQSWKMEPFLFYLKWTDKCISYSKLNRPVGAWAYSSYGNAKWQAQITDWTSFAHSGIWNKILQIQDLIDGKCLKVSFLQTSYNLNINSINKHKRTILLFRACEIMIKKVFILWLSLNAISQLNKNARGFAPLSFLKTLSLYVSPT